ncbi:MAG: hypothetical protein ACK5YP_01960 [Betaproteobacteria bacterium]|jgi:hypothetical protein
MKVRAGTYHDALALAAPKMRRMESRTLALQCFRSDMAAVEDARGLAAVIGFWPLGVTDHAEAAFELWTFSRPQLPAATVRFLVRLAHVTMLNLAQSQAVAVVSRTQAGWIPGRKLHRLIGMSPVPPDFPGLETFVWRSRDGEAGQERVRLIDGRRPEQGPEAGAAAGAAAAAGVPDRPTAGGE